MSKIPPIRYVGNFDVASEGKNIWEILCSLKNLGTGRLIKKTEWNLRWPNQPSYLKIVKARPEMDPWLHKGKVWAEWVFRGRNLGVYEFSTDLNRADWKLVHKHEEKELLETKSSVNELNIPATFPLPPLQNYINQRQAEKQGYAWDQKKEGRAKLDICLDPQFSMYNDLITRSEPKQTSHSIYDEVDPESYLDLYGQVLPTKVESWALGPAAYKPRFKPQQS